MPTPTRFPNGVTTAKKTETLGYYGEPDPTKWFTYFNDFRTALDTNAGIWTTTKVGTGTWTVPDGANGVSLITNTAADDDSIFNKLGSSFCSLAAGKKAIFKTRLTVSDITQADWIIGLHISDTTPFVTGGGGDSVTDGIYFGKEDGSTSIDFYVQKNTTTGQKISLGVATQEAAGTYYTLGFVWDGVRYVDVFKNDVKVSSVDLGSSPTDFLPDALLTIGFGLVNGEAVAKTMSVDYLFFATER